MMRQLGRCDLDISKTESYLAVICRPVTIDLALPISFGAIEPGLGDVSSSIRVHVWSFLTILTLGLSGCVCLYTGGMSKER